MGYDSGVMTLPTPPRTRLHEIFDRIHRLGCAALETIPFVGHGLAGFFERSVAPVVMPLRDRILSCLHGRFKTLAESFHVALIRLLPLPRAPRPRDPGGRRGA